MSRLRQVTHLVPLIFASVFAIVAVVSCGSVTSGDADASVVIDAPPPDAAEEFCAKAPCDLFEQCGCTDPQVCDLDLQGLPAGDTKCRDVNAMGRELDRCAALEDCDGGYLCGGGQCLLYCQDDQDCVQGQDSICIRKVASGQGTDTVPGVLTCSKPCSPEGLNNNNNCPSDFACRIFTANSGQANAFNFSDCIIGGPGANDADCSANGNNDCGPGFLCVIFGDGSGSRCRQTCPVGGAATCVIGGQVCREFGTAPELNGVEYGFCDVAAAAAPATPAYPSQN